MRSLLPFLMLGSAACDKPDADDGDSDVIERFDPANPDDWDELFPAPDTWETTGPGLGRVTFTQEELFQGCATLQGDPDLTRDHHNLVVMYDGYLVMPWSPEDGGGGITLWDVSDPCKPTKVGEGFSPTMRESHSLGFSVIEGRTYLVVDYLAEWDEAEEKYPEGGVGFWDLTDPAMPVWAGEYGIEGHVYPDSYTRLTLSTFWQGPYVFASTAFNGVAVLDAADPTAVTEVQRIRTVGHQVGTFHVWGNRAMASSAGLARTVMWDVADPMDPQPVLGGDFDVAGEAGGRPVSYYFANITADYALFARKDNNGGPILYDVSDPSAPTFVGHLPQADGDGGYIFEHNGFLFQGESNYGAVYDIADPTAPVEVGRVQLKGDLDTLTPLGNLMVAAVDEKADFGKASLIAPWAMEPDSQPPRGGMRSPEDGAVDQPVTSRIGIIFDEMLEPVSAVPGAVRVVTEAGEPIEVLAQVQENILNLTPVAPLPAGETIHVQLPADGLADVSGNRLEQSIQWSFTVAE